MNLSRCLCMTRGLNTKVGPACLVRFSTKSVPTKKSKDYVENVVEEPKFYEELLNVEARVERRKPAIQPFAKNLFLALFDREILAFPEILNKEEKEALDTRVEQISRITSDSSLEDRQVWKAMLEGRIVGAPAPVFHGGLAANCTEKLRMLEEIAKQRFTVAGDVNRHWLGMECLTKGLSSGDVDSMLSDFASGRFRIRVLIREGLAEELDVTDLRTLGNRKTDGSWTITGEKICEEGEGWRGGEYVVLVAVIEHGLTQAFLVRPDAPRVSYGDTYVRFDETPATLLGEDTLHVMLEATAVAERGDRPKVPVTPVQLGLTHFRLTTSAMALGLLKAATLTTIKQIRGKYVGGKPFADLPIFQKHIADALTVLYNIESMTYLTAGLQDGYESPDTELEAILTRIYSTKEACRVIRQLQTSLCTLGLQGDLKKHAEDAAALMHEEQNDSLAVYGALLGIQHVGETMADSIYKKRNPAMHSNFIISRIIRDWRHRRDQPVLNMHLAEHLHQSLADAALNLEYCVQRLYYGVEMALTHHGNDILTEHTDLERLTRISIETYAMMCSLARASRSYCVGVRGSEKELYQSLVVCHRGKERVRQWSKEIEEGRYMNADEPRKDLAEAAVQNKGPFAEHCLTRVIY